MDFIEQIAKAIAEAAGRERAEIVPLIDIPPDTAMGDFAFPCFKLSKELKKSPNLIAEQLALEVKLPSGISSAQAKGPYLNFFADKSVYAGEVLREALDKGESYGAENIGGGKNVCIDYSSINIAKPFHIGHLSTTAIGNALYRIYKFMGYNPVGINHLGDWGTQFGKMIVAYKKWGNEADIQKETTRGLVKLYVKYHEEAEKNPALDDEARAWFRKIELKDPEATELFNLFKEITMKDVMKVYELLGVSFDSYAGESFYEDKMQEVVDRLREKELLIVDQGASIVDLSEYDMPPCLILRSDGATLYATRDLATAIYRKREYDFVKSLYVVAYQQSLHFRQVFKVLELMGFDWVKDMEHVSFGMVSIEDGTLSTRHGNVVYLEDVLNAAIDKTKLVMKEKSPDLADSEEIARAVGVGAVIWGVLYNGRIKDIEFSWDKALNFDGDTGPYAQYTHARCCSVLNKAGGAYTGWADYSLLGDDASFAVVKALNGFKQAVKSALVKNEPYLIPRSITEICSAYNKFYYENRIIDAEENLRAVRLKLTEAVRNTIKTGLHLIGISAPERM